MGINRWLLVHIRHIIIVRSYIICKLTFNVRDIRRVDGEFFLWARKVAILYEGRQ